MVDPMHSDPGSVVGEAEHNDGRWCVLAPEHRKWGVVTEAVRPAAPVIPAQTASMSRRGGGAAGGLHPGDWTTQQLWCFFFAPEQEVFVV